MKKRVNRCSIKLFVIIVSVLFSSGCGTRSTETVGVSEETPLPQFLIGTWQYEGKHKYEGSESVADVFWVYRFVDEKKLLIWAGNDGGTCAYRFIEAELLSIDCSPRMNELMIWSINRDGQDLLIQRLGGPYGDGELLRFERVKTR
jgi:hypothetical protein